MPATSGDSLKRCQASTKINPEINISTMALINAEKISVLKYPYVFRLLRGFDDIQIANSASACPPTSVSMCAASDSSARLLEIKPTITSTIKNDAVMAKTIFKDLLCFAPAEAGLDDAIDKSHSIK